LPAVAEIHVLGIRRRKAGVGSTREPESVNTEKPRISQLPRVDLVAAAGAVVVAWCSAGVRSTREPEKVPTRRIKESSQFPVVICPRVFASRLRSGPEWSVVQGWPRIYKRTREVIHTENQRIPADDPDREKPGRRFLGFSVLIAFVCSHVTGGRHDAALAWDQQEN